MRASSRLATKVRKDPYNNYDENAWRYDWNTAKTAAQKKNILNRLSTRPQFANLVKQFKAPRGRGARIVRSGAGPAETFIESGQTANIRESRKKIIPYIELALRPGANIPNHIVEKAHELRLLNPTQMSSYSGGNLENEGMTLGARTRGIEVVDFRKPPYTQDRDAGINPLNLIYKTYIPKDWMPDDPRLRGSQKRNQPTYFIKARFDFNPLRFYAGYPVPRYAKNSSAPTNTWSNISKIAKFAQMANAQSDAWHSIINFTDFKYFLNSKGTFAGEPDVCYFNGSNTVHLIELKITSGKPETFPAEAIQLAKLKRLVQLWISSQGPYMVKTFFLPWKFANNTTPINYKNWLRPSNGANYQTIKKLAERIIAVDPNFNPKVVDNNRVNGPKPVATKANALPGMNLAVANQKLRLARGSRYTRAANFAKWYADRIIINGWINNKRSLLNGSLNERGSPISDSRIKRAFAGQAQSIFRGWLHKQNITTLHRYLSASNIDGFDAWLKTIGTINSNGTFRGAGVETAGGPNTEITSETNQNKSRFPPALPRLMQGWASVITHYGSAKPAMLTWMEKIKAGMDVGEGNTRMRTNVNENVLTTLSELRKGDITLNQAKRNLGNKWQILLNQNPNIRVAWDRHQANIRALGGNVNMGSGNLFS